MTPHLMDHSAPRAARRITVIAALLISGSGANAAPASKIQLTPSLGYEFVTGSADYYSHSISGGLSARFKVPVKLSAHYVFMSDKDYDAIHSGILRLKGPLSAAWDGQCGFTISGGSVRDSDAGVSSAGFDFGGTRYIGRAWDWFSGYRYVSGSFSTEVSRQTVSAPDRRGRAVQQAVTVQDENVSKYVAHTFSQKIGYANQTHLRGLYSGFRLALTANSDDAVILSEGLETYIPLPQRFTLGFSFTMNQNSKFADLNYFGVSLDKLF